MGPSVELLEFQALSRKLGTATATLLANQWTAGGLWEDRLWQASATAAAGQVRAVELADQYMTAQLGGSDAALQPRAFAGVASDGRSLPGLLRGASVAANQALAAEAPEAVVRAQLGMESQRTDAARRAAESWLRTVALTLTSDAVRAGLRAGMAVRNASGIRIASRPCCGRCAVLHGRFYSWRADFQRHPRCDCTFQLVRHGEDWQAPEEIPLDQIRGLSQADRQAIELGADRSAVINAQRGMQSVTSYGKTVKGTSEGMTKRGDAYKRLVRDRAQQLGLTEKQLAGRVDRLRPESILDQARDQEDAMRLLRLHGYIA